MSRGIVEQITELLNGPVTTVDLLKIEKAVREAKRKAQATAKQDFWEGKTTCWEICSCPSSLHLECPTFKNRQFPCWEIEGTYCKLDDYGATGRDTNICQICSVYKKYGNNEPIKIKLLGQGFNPTFAQKAKENVSRVG